MLQERKILFNMVPREELPDFLVPAYDRAEEIGDTVNFQVMANNPTMARWFVDCYERLFNTGTVPTSVKELARMRLSRTHGCAMCSRWDAADMLEIGYTPEQVDAIGAWPDPVDLSLFSEEEAAVLRLTDQMVLPNMNGALSPELYAELRRFYDDAAIVELGYMMSFFTGLMKFMMISDLLPKLETCPMPGNVGADADLKVVPAQKLQTPGDFKLSVPRI